MIEFNAADREAWDRIFGNIRPEWAAGWKSAAPLPAMKACLAFFRENGVESVLDLGCGVGVWAVYLARNGLRVHGCDFSRPAVEFARRWADEEGLSVEFSVASLGEAPFQRRFDAVLASQILDNVSREERAAAVEGARRCLRPGGVLFALFNPYLTAEQREALKKSDNPTKDITHVVYTDGELRDAFPGFALAGFETYPPGSRGLMLRKEG